MRADIHDGREHKRSKSEAGYIDARPHQPGSTKTSCDARPDHTIGSKREVAFFGLMSASTSCGHHHPLVKHATRGEHGYRSRRDTAPHWALAFPAPLLREPQFVSNYQRGPTLSAFKK